MLRSILLVILLSLSQTDSHELYTTKSIYGEFIDVFRTSEDCLTLCKHKIIGLNELNQTYHIGLVKAELFGKYIEMRHGGLTDVIIEPLLNLYCRAKSYVPIVLNEWEPPPYVKGNFTWNLTDDFPENDDFHIAKHKERVYLEVFEQQKELRINLASKQKEGKSPRNADIRQFYRIVAFIVSLSLALSLHNLLRMIYEEEDDEDEIDPNGGWGFYGEIAQITILCCSLFFILMLMYEDVE